MMKMMDLVMKNDEKVLMVVVLWVGRRKKKRERERDE